MAKKERCRARRSVWLVGEQLETLTDVGSRGLSLEVAGVVRRLPAAWLRLHCPCDECMLPALGERRVRLGPADDQTIANAHLVGDSLIVEWVSGHRSDYSAELLASLVAAPHRRMTEPVLWRSDHEPTIAVASEVLNDEAARLSALHALRDFGVLRVRGLDVDDEATIRFLRDLRLPIWEGPFGVTVDALLVDEPFNVSESAEELPLHTDLAGYAWPPSGQFLHMLCNEATGGDSIVVDGFSVLDDLRQDLPDAFAVLAEVEVAHRLHSPDRETYGSAPLIRLGLDGAVVGVRFSNQTLEPLPLDEPRISEWYDAYSELTTRLHDDRYAVRFRLDAGDAYLVHSHRVLHARTAFDAAGARHLRDAYFEFDNVLGLIDLLEGVAR